MFRLRDPEPHTFEAVAAGAAPWNPNMTKDSTFPLAGETNLDDLPRTLRREHEARAREARERDGPALSSGLIAGMAASSTSSKASASSIAPPVADMTYMATDSMTTSNASISAVPVPAIVKAVDVPFFDLVKFFLKAVIAAIPAAILMMVVLWGIGQIIETVAPNLLKAKILISFPNS